MHSLESLKIRIDAALEKHLSSAALKEPLASALHYALFPAGKRIRPLFSLALYADLGRDPQALIDAACAIELLHASSLVHDDLPALDNDDYRRGRPSLHKAFGEATAILAGDYLIPLAFGCLSHSPVASETCVAMTQALSRAFAEVCYGQQLDILPVKRAEDILRVHQHKTAALFRCAAEFASLMANLSEEEHSKFGSLGRDIGLCFQMLDDCLDVFGSNEQRGRAGSSDKRNQKMTYFQNSTEREGLKLINALSEQVQRSFQDLQSLGDFERSRALFEALLGRMPDSIAMAATR